MKKTIFRLKNSFKICRIIAFAAIIGFFISSCNKETGSLIDSSAYEKLSAARFVPELHEVLPEFTGNSKSSASKTSVKSSGEEVSELNVADLEGSYNLAHNEYLISYYFDGVRGMININKDAMINRLANPDVKANKWNDVKEYQTRFGTTEPFATGDYLKWRFSESNGKMTIWEETRHTNSNDDLRRRTITLHADGAAEMYEHFTLNCKNCYTSISPPFLSGNNSMMYSYCKGNDFIFISISPEISSISYMVFSENNGNKTGDYVSSLFNSSFQITSFEGNNTELLFKNHHGSIYASDNVFRSSKDITIMKDGVSMTFFESDEHNRCELSIDAQAISEIEKLYFIYPDKVLGKHYEPVGMLLTDGTELSLSEQPFEMSRAIVNFQLTGALGATVRFFTADRNYPVNVFDILPEVFDKTIAAQKFTGTNYVEKIAALPDFQKNFRIRDAPDFEVNLENTENIITAISTLIVSKKPEKGF